MPANAPQWWQMFLLVSLQIGVRYATGNENIRICDSSSTYNAAPEPYKSFIKTLYNQGFSIKAYDASKIDDAYNLGTKLTVSWPTAYLIPSMKSSNSLIDKKYTEQILSLKFNANYEKPLHNFVAKTVRSTVWTSVTFDYPQYYDLSAWKCAYDFKPKVGQIECIHPFYRLSKDLFNGPQTFSSHGITGFDGYITFAKALYSGTNKKLVQVNDGDGNVVWGVLMAGCTPPQFMIQFFWEETLQNQEKCNKPVIMVTDIVEAPNFICKMDFTSNQLRTKGSTTEAMASLMRNRYALSTLDQSQMILISSSHAKAISNCIFPQNNKLSSKWDSWTESAPGKCVACNSLLGTPGNSYTTRIPRACNRTFEMQDCCFDCARGYNKLFYKDPNLGQVPHCIKACLNGFAYNDETAQTPLCVACPAAKYSQKGKGGVGGCKTCEEVGISNAIVDAKRGCVSCGSRSQVVDQKCSPCPLMQFVPDTKSKCQSCPAGSILISSESTLCTPCPAGFRESSGICALCPINTFKAKPWAGECLLCPYASRSLPNRTACVACNNLDKTLTPYAIYSSATGCSVDCNRSVSYAYNSNPYARDGCRPCSERTPPIGTYPATDDCSHFLPCTNAPSSVTAEYIAGGTTCAWDCKKGYAKSGVGGTTCTQCTGNGFNPNIHVYTSGCIFACIPMVYYRGASGTDTSCTQLCTNLALVRDIFPLLSDYYIFFLQNGSSVSYSTSRPNYIMGGCGSQEKDPTSNLPLLRYVGIYGYLSAQAGGGGLCGNYLLNTGEECDDGNTFGGDGCSSSCFIERNGYWDCNLIGEACKPLCGWTLAARDAWGVGLQGFVFDPRNAIQYGIPWCTGVTYQEVLRVPIAERNAWMLKYLGTCNCKDNPMQVLPYSECNYTNGGCRACQAGYYMDDLYGRCSPCGSACAVGFRPFNPLQDTLNNDLNTRIRVQYNFSASSGLQQCGPSIATSKHLTYANPVDKPFLFGRDQIMMGCVPCTLGGLNRMDMVVFVKGTDGGTCNWVCKRDPANQTDADYYCAQSDTSVCNGACLLCDDSLKNVRASLQTGVGKYILPCMDKVGHGKGDCNSLDSVPNAMYTGNSIAVVADRGGCPWQCNAGYQRFEDTCLRCYGLSAATVACKEGEMMLPCQFSSNYYYCAPCSVLKQNTGELKPLEVWRSLPQFAGCVGGCEDGVSFKNESMHECERCTRHTCNLDELYVACMHNADATCVPCPTQNLQEKNQEYFNEGTCTTRCIAGYAMQGGACSLCSQLRCDLGQHGAHACQAETERDALPDCVQCVVNEPLNLPTTGREWVRDTDCLTTCAMGWRFEGGTNRTCVPCPMEACPTGFETQCLNGQMQCKACDTTAVTNNNMKHSGPGNCTAVCISSAYTLPWAGASYCQPILTSDQGSASDTNTVDAPVAIIVEYGVDLLTINNATVNATLGLNANTRPLYPVRQIPHSAYDVVAVPLESSLPPVNTADDTTTTNNNTQA